MESRASSYVIILLVAGATGCGSATGRLGPGGAGGSAGTGGSAGASGSAGAGGSAGASGAGPACDGEVNWPMPNAAGSGLPNPASYDTSKPGVVVDQVTGLMWQREVPGSSYDWHGAQTYCAGLTLAGHHDWRLPSEIELLSLVDFAKTDPAIDSALPGTPSSGSWSSTTLSSRSSDAWIVYFGDGRTTARVKNDSGPLRCVRCGSSPSPTAHERFTVTAGTVKDNRTGLTWEQAASNGSWSAGDSYCKQLTPAGGGWRMPSIKELATLFDYTNASDKPSLDPVAFPDAGWRWYWSSTSDVGSAAYFWTFNFGGGDPLASGGEARSEHFGNANNYTRCVR